MHVAAVFRKTFEWNTLANLRIISAMQLAGPDDTCVELLSHCLTAEHIWFLRIEGFDTRTREVWPQLRLNECLERCRENDAIAAAYFSNATDAELSRTVQYRNSKGEIYSGIVSDILTHVSHHSAYHRAQINQRLRKAGAAAAVVDFISFTRGEWTEAGISGQA